MELNFPSRVPSHLKRKEGRKDRQKEGRKEEKKEGKENSNSVWCHTNLESLLAEISR